MRFIAQVPSETGWRGIMAMLLCSCQTSGPDYVCSSSVPIGDVLAQLRSSSEADNKYDILQTAAHILKDKAKFCKHEQDHTDSSVDISYEVAAAIVPNALLTFSCQLLSDKKLKLEIKMLHVMMK